MMTPPDEEALEAFVSVSAALLDLPIAGAHRDAVVANMRALFEHGRLVTDFPLAFAAAPALEFRA